MCGIFAVVNDKTNSASETVVKGLKRLEYRGYDSWGVAVASDHKIEVIKKVGKISDVSQIKNLPISIVSIGHTRWATTGAVTQINAHPHYASDHSFVVAQNGIVENYEELKQMLVKKKCQFISETDTEVIVRLIEDELKKETELLNAVRLAFLKLTGRNTIILMTKEGEIMAVRNGSPLVIGINPKGNDVYIASDAFSFAPFAQKMIVVNNGQIVRVYKNEINIFDVETGKKVDYVLEDILIDNSKVDKEGFPHFMLKEIYEAPYVLEQLIKQDSKSLDVLAQAIKKAKNVYTIGSGTAGAAAAQIAFYLRENAKINAVSLIGAESRDYYDLITKDDIVIAPSQSGETADVLEVLEFLKKKGVKIASYVNMPGSAMTRLSDYQFMAKAGPEICVLSTKVFLSQISWGYLVSQTVVGKYEKAIRNISILSKQIKNYLENQKNIDAIKKLAEHLTKKHDIFLLGKYQNFQIMKEGMIKLIEATYKHAHAIPSGDLKHYAITIMEKGVPVIVALSNDKVRWDVLNAINEVRLRGSEIIAISPEFHEIFDFYINVPDLGETSAMINIIPLWLLAYYLGVKLGRNVDKPRNIAKSVTVK